MVGLKKSMTIYGQKFEKLACLLKIYTDVKLLMKMV
jgi:hypothetical protein